MAATKYQLLYRYINEATNIAITNESTEEYVPVREFYTMDHAIFSSDAQTKAAAEDEQQEMIANANDPGNVKTNMLFAFEGTKKIRHQKWVKDETGYVVRDWRAIPRSRIGNRGDFTKEFTTLGAETPEDGGIVVCKVEVFNKYFPATIDCGITPDGGDLSNSYGKYYSPSYIKSLIVNSTMFELEDTNDLSIYMKPASKSKYWAGDVSYSQNIGYYKDYTNYYPSSSNFSYDGTTEPLVMPTRTSSHFGPPEIVNGYAAGTTGLSTGATIRPNQVKTTTIEAHYEDVTEDPYLVIDTYKTIPMSPWFVHATYGSLEAALEKAKTLVEMLGIENIKLIKIVPFDQFIKIS